MPLHTFDTAPAFVAIDLPGAEVAAGVARSAPKILQGGAHDLARSLTYTYASLELPISGASAGVNAAPDDRAEAVGSFVEGVATMTSPKFLVDAAKGVEPDELLPLRSADPRHPARYDDVGGLPRHMALTIVGAVAAAGDLGGKRVAIDAPAALVAAIAAQAGQSGAEVVAAGTADIGVLRTGADVLFVGSKIGAIDHELATDIAANVIVPVAPLALTARGFAVLRASGKWVLPDFVTLAGGPATDHADHSIAASDLNAVAVAAVTGILADVAGHAEGPLMAACYRAEAFLSTWQDELPFGRPFAT